MTEPLTDEKFKAIKAKRTRCLYRKEWTIEEIDSLIATIELQKSDLNLGASLVRKSQELKKENAKLKLQLDAALKRIEEME